MPRATAVAVLLAVLIAGFAFPAAAQVAPAGAAPEPPVVGQIKGLNDQARKAFDSYSFRGAKRKLEQALRLAADSRLTKHPVLARTYLLLGITAISGSNDLYRGLHYFVRATRLDPKIKLPKVLATPQLVQMFRRAAKARKAVGKPPTIILGTAEQEKVTERKTPKARKLGLVHSAVDSAKQGFPIPIKVQLGVDVQAHKVYLYFRSAGQVKYKRIQLQKLRDTFRIAIPAEVTRGRYLHYYLEAMDQRGRLAARHGSGRSPNVTIMK